MQTPPWFEKVIMPPDRKWLVLQIAALGYEFLVKNRQGEALAGFEVKPLEPFFPALTCPVQASFITASKPCVHGIVGNGFFDRRLLKPFFWEQSAELVAGRRIWKNCRLRGKKVAQLFWQQSLGVDVDIVISPAPIHKHHGGMIQDCFCRPRGLYPGLVKQLGRRFPLHAYWGPFASGKSSRWIVDATRYVMENLKPELLLSYIPHLDYELQRSGTSSKKSVRALGELEIFISDLMQAAKKQDYDVLMFSDYAITDINEVVFPNRALYEAGVLSCRSVKGMLYPDFYTSRAFAIIDHQVAHVILRDQEAKKDVLDLLSDLSGLDKIFDKEEQKDLGICHERSGDLVLTAKSEAWFAYPWWRDNSQLPDYATHVDIHNKPGYDPCELFWERHPFRVAQDCSRIKGSHGLANRSSRCCWATTSDLPFNDGTIVELGKAFSRILES